MLWDAIALLPYRCVDGDRPSPNEHPFDIYGNLILVCAVLEYSMSFPLQERYINLLTDFGFKRVFESELNKVFVGCPDTSGSNSYISMKLGTGRCAMHTFR